MDANVADVYCRDAEHLSVFFGYAYGNYFVNWVK